MTLEADKSDGLRTIGKLCRTCGLNGKLTLTVHTCSIAQINDGWFQVVNFESAGFHPAVFVNCKGVITYWYAVCTLHDAIESTYLPRSASKYITITIITEKQSLIPDGGIRIIDISGVVVADFDFVDDGQSSSFSSYTGGINRWYSFAGTKVGSWQIP